MAVYKIPQDVEADDKFVGPLSFKQFIYCGIAAICGYLSFLSLTKGLWPALVLFLPIIIASGFLGFPWGRDQPTEIWLAARIRFFIKPRMRIWNQSGIKDLVTVTAPKHVERHYTNGLSQDEVSSRLGGLADLLDSRGWAVKNVNVNMYNNGAGVAAIAASDDRLLGVTSLPQEVVDVTANDDVLDESNNPTAQHFEQMIKSSEEKHRQDVMAQLQAARSASAPVAAGPAYAPTPAAAVPAEAARTSTANSSHQAVMDQLMSARSAPTATPTEDDAQHAPKKPAHDKADFWFLQHGSHDEGAQATTQDEPPADFRVFQAPAVVAPHGTAPVVAVTETTAASQQVSAGDEQALLNKIHHDHQESYNPFGHIKTIQPIDDQPVAQPAAQAVAQTPQTTPPTPVTPPVNPAIIHLASNDDLNVATIARQADKTNEQNLSDGEVVISLH